MDLRQLRYFVTVCEEESFSRAAQRLHMTQPPLSTTVSALERELGIQLLHRVQHGVLPTEAGQILANRAAQILRQSEDLRTHLSGLGAGHEGHLTISAAPAFSWKYIPAIIREFTRAAPRATLTLVDPNPEVIVEDVLRGGTDVGAVICPDPTLFRSQYADRLNILTVGELPPVLALPLSWEQGDVPVDARELSHLTWFLPKDNQRFPGLRRMTEQLWSSWHHEMPPVQEVSTLQTAMPLIAGGLGVSLMPSSIREFHLSAITTRPLAQKSPPMAALMIWSKETTPSPIAQRFISIATEVTQLQQ